MSKHHRTAALLSLALALAFAPVTPARGAMGPADEQAGVTAAGQPPALNTGIPALGDDDGGQMKTDLSVAANAVFSGTYNVGAGQPFTSLTNLGGIFGAINAGALSGNVIINITSDLTGELGTNALNEWAEAGAGGYSLLIRPSGAPHTITGSINDALIRLNGADRVTLDGSLGGGKDRSLTIQNTNPLTSAMVIALPSGANGAQNNTLKNLTVLGQDAGTTRAGIALSGAPGSYAFVEPIVGGAGNHGNRVENCAVGRAQVGIYSAGELANPNIGTEITQNDVGDVSPNGVTIMTISRKGIVVLYDSDVQITQNRVGVANSHFDLCYCVGIGVGSYAWGDGGVLYGGETTNAFVSRNYIVAVQDWGTRSVVGIAVNDRGSSTVVNNIVVGLGGLRTNWYSNVTGIGVYGSIVKVYNNAVVMHQYQRIGAEGNTFGIANFGGTISLKNNSIDNTISNPFAFNGARPYAVGSLGGSLDSDYNHFLASPSFRIGTTGLRPTDGGVSYLDLASWQAAVSQDAHSFVVVPGYSAFLAPNDFHRRTGYPLPYVGTPLAEVTEDFDGEPRVAPYDIGPDQVWIDVAVAMAASPALLSPGAAVTYTLAFSSLINAGPSVATGAVISDRVPLGVTITGVTSSTFGSGVRITQTSGAPNFAWALSDLAVGEGGFITLTGFLDPAATGGLITNTATITASDDLTPTNNSAAATFTVGVAACYATPDAGTTVFATTDGQAVQRAIDAAGSGGTVKVAGRCAGAQSLAGATQTGYISKSLTLRGGYTNTLASWAGAGDPAASPTTLDAAQAGRVLYITGGIDVAVQNLRLTGGSATAGGGVYNNAARTTISNTLIYSNSAASGGGVRNQSAGELTLDASTVTSNTATADGGGLLNIDSGSVVTLTNGSRVQANTAGSNGGGLWNASAGRVLIAAGTVASNTAGVRGGGLFNQSAGVVSIDGGRVVSNTAAANGGGINNIGGVILITNGGLLGNNRANAGGGILNEAAGQVTLDGSALAANTAAASGGGIYNTDSGSAVTLTQGSRAQANSAIVGAGLWNGFAGQVALDASAIVSNTASNIGGGVYNAGSALTLANVSRVEVNTASAGGGLWNGVAGQVTLDASTVASNTASASGGGINNTGGVITITRGSLLGNRAANGGGIYQFGPSPGRIVNTLFARNSATTNGAAIYVDGAAPLSLIHTTLVSPTAPSGATQAVYVAAGTVYLRNTLIATHTIGIARVGGTVRDWNTLFAGIATPYSGMVTSVGGITGTAGFVNPTADDYHLGAGSAAINAGVDAGVTVDVDGQARPQAGGYDIGYDESAFALLSPKAYLPFVVR